ncbi:1-phosphofructokinase [uncultured Pseudoflavonifractor sp.]|uniref:1-phosphofructokinase n=1 Tax=uncultured Pseudoflavonifractor sp. TaxID=1221379 RepID=UPI0025D76AE4|nr:1-phosphofructokinase [uncultured Pseudoflavonifractor sp.]
MIYTVTFNPALDYAVYLDTLEMGTLNRTKREALRCGGKGINVSIVLRNLGMDTKALGFLAGFTGQCIALWLDQMSVPNDFIMLPSGISRINIKLKTGVETEINGQGPDIPPQALEQLFSRLDSIKKGDTLVLAGSIPASLPADIYEHILSRISGRGIRCVVDASGPLLLNVLRYHPFLIKPNQEELSELCGVSLSSGDPAGIKACAAQLQEQGARNVLVSLGPNGALLLTEDGKFLRQEAAAGTVRNSVGAGDSMVAGFLTGLHLTGSYREALLMGAAAGAATAFSDHLATRQEVEQLLNIL